LKVFFFHENPGVQILNIGICSIFERRANVKENVRRLPGCCFPDRAEATYGRSFERFARMVEGGNV